MCVYHVFPELFCIDSRVVWVSCCSEMLNSASHRKFPTSGQSMLKTSRHRVKYH